VANEKDRQEEVLLRTYHGSDSHMLSEKTNIAGAMVATMRAVHPEYAERLANSFESLPPLPTVFSQPEYHRQVTKDPICHVYREARSIWPDREIRIASFMPEPERDLWGYKADMKIRGFKSDSSNNGRECHLFRVIGSQDFVSTSFDERAKSFWADG